MLNAALAETPGPLCRAIVLHETASTQDAARRLNLKPGDVVTAGRQTQGRGRLGRSWCDDAGEGTAVTAVLHRDAPERLAIAAAVAATLTAESILKRTVGIKWPNDIMVENRKLAGILVEQSSEIALLGIGMNVLQRSWPAELKHIAISMAELGVSPERCRVLAELLRTLNEVLRWDQDQLIDAFSARDILRGTRARFRCEEKEIEGVVSAIDPMDGLTVQTHGGEIRLPAATTRVLKDEERGQSVSPDRRGR